MQRSPKPDDHLSLEAVHELLRGEMQMKKHVHRWRLGMPEGGKVEGVCLCGKKRSWPDDPVENRHWRKTNALTPRKRGAAR